MRAAFVSLACVMACACSEVPRGSHASALNGGDQENGFPGTVLMYWTDGFSGAVCSGTVVAPRVIVSAKHCYIDTGAGGWSANVGPTGQTQSLGVVDVLMPPGNELENEDIAVVLLGEDINADAVDLRRDFGGLRPGDGATLVGYGENPDDGQPGRKYSGDADILGFGPIDEAGVGDQEILLEGAAACGGDSGGSTLDGNGDLMAVIVRGADVDCSEATFTVATRIDGFLDLIDQGIQQSQGCVASGPEVCDWADNDCDGAVDEGCASFAQPCSDQVPCQPGHICAPIGGVGEPACTLACDPGANPLEVCGIGSNAYCLAWGCGDQGGHCILIGAGARTAEVGAPCAGDGDCANFYCRDPQDGAGRRCMTRCEDDTACGAGSICGAVEQGCGGCVPEGGDPLLHGFGQACETNEQCASSLCGIDDDGRFCTQECGDCPEGYHCARGECARGEASDDQGQPCNENEDCETGLCAHWPDGESCTRFCSDRTPCPAGLTCTDIGDDRSACKPDKSVVGQPCTSNDDCQSSLCGNFPDDRGTVCTEPCAGGACPLDLECIEASGLTLCAPPITEPEKSTYGCGCTIPGTSPRAPAMLLALLGLVVARRRRRSQAR